MHLDFNFKREKEKEREMLPLGEYIGRIQSGKGNKLTIPKLEVHLGN